MVNRNTRTEDPRDLWLGYILSNLILSNPFPRINHYLCILVITAEGLVMTAKDKIRLVLRCFPPTTPELSRFIP